MTKTIKLMVTNDHGCYCYYVELTKDSDVPFSEEALNHNFNVFDREKFAKFLKDLDVWSKEENFNYVVKNEWDLVVKKSRL